MTVEKIDHVLQTAKPWETGALQKAHAVTARPVSSKAEVNRVRLCGEAYVQVTQVIGHHSLIVPAAALPDDHGLLQSVMYTCWI